MRGFSSAVLSLAAMGLSTVTTYLTFFDARYTLTQAIADVPIQLQSGGGYSDGEADAYFRFFPTFDLILSNRGTRPVVVSDLEIYRSAAMDQCELTGEPMYMQDFQPVIVEPGTVSPFSVEVSLPNLERSARDGEAFDLSGEEALYCFQWTLFDPNGRRHEPIAEALTVRYTLLPPPEGERYPDITVEKDFPRRPERLISRGFF
ncbi:MAG: hypothetical protein AAFQ84_02825 [Pseudomonadota bacterium]